VNDKNEDVMNAWRTVKESPNNIISYFKKCCPIFISMSKEDKLKWCRKKLVDFTKESLNSKRAALYILLKYCAYMGHILINNVYQIVSLDMKIYAPMRLYFFSEEYYENIRKVSEYLVTSGSKGLMFSKDYKRILEMTKKGDFVFLDPPYEETINYKFNYNIEGGTPTSGKGLLEELKSECAKLDVKGVKWLMTQADTKAVRETFQKYHISTFPVYRRQANVRKLELLIKNYA